MFICSVGGTCRVLIQCDATLQETMFSNIFLSGGSTLFSGLAGRLTTELSLLASADLTINKPSSIVVTVSTDSIHAVWIGGAMFAAHDNFSQQCMSKEVYDESGPNMLVHRCF